jgi:hypothetical protein
MKIIDSAVIALVIVAGILATVLLFMAKVGPPMETVDFQIHEIPPEGPPPARHRI